MPRISQLPDTSFPALEYEVPASKGGETHRLTLAQVKSILALLSTDIKRPGEDAQTVEAALEALNSGKASASDFATLVNSVGSLSNSLDGILESLENGEFAGFPIGASTIFYGKRAAIWDGFTAEDGDLLLRADFPELWAFVSAGGMPLVSETAWQSDPLLRGSFSSGNGTTTFRMPDRNGKQTGSLKGPFPRGDSGLDSNAGKMLGDAIRNISGSFPVQVPQSHSTYTTGAFTGASALGASSPVYGSLAAGSGVTDSGRFGYTLDASRQVPTAGENRPVSSIGIAVMRTHGGLAPGFTGTDPATRGANIFNGAQRINGDLEVTGNITMPNFPRLGAGSGWVVDTTLLDMGVVYTNTSKFPMFLRILINYTDAGGRFGVKLGRFPDEDAAVYSPVPSSLAAYAIVEVMPGETYQYNSWAGAISSRTIRRYYRP